MKDAATVAEIGDLELVLRACRKRRRKKGC